MENLAHMFDAETTIIAPLRPAMARWSSETDAAYKQSSVSLSTLRCLICAGGLVIVAAAVCLAEIV